MFPAGNEIAAVKQSVQAGNKTESCPPDSGDDGTGVCVELDAGRAGVCVAAGVGSTARDGFESPAQAPNPKDIVTRQIVLFMP
jgi:hypothetical protein